ncbi:Glycerol kinase 5 isoform X1 [Oopsacas minuta]|uniref:Glycerol kinase 5 n=1 Tax=Oopsacas minuta TaxID=111878 RepID=A0AAV7KE48_9METZ|nr:Glycerol kinase 5 isoform X1 [Oopsacas minuta]
MSHVLAIDIGSTSIKCIAVNKQGQQVSHSQNPITTLRPEAGWVEIDPHHIWEVCKSVILENVRKGGFDIKEIVGLGIACQRNTFTLWRRSTGEPVINFLSWQDLRSLELCKEWNESNTFKAIRFGSKILRGITHADKFIASSILQFTPQHAVIRLYWVFKNMPNILKLGNDNDLCFGTIDTWLVWKFTNGRMHITDYSNASSTVIFDPFTMTWSTMLCNLLGFPMSILPEIKLTSEEYCRIDENIFGVSFPIGALVADQSASAFANRCWKKGDIKMTLGTGGFIDICQGQECRASLRGYYPLIGWVDKRGPNFITESNIPSMGTTIEWAMSLGLCTVIEELSDIANSVSTSNGVVFVPSLGGLPAPFEEYNTDGAFMGLNLRMNTANMVRAILEGLAFQIRCLYEIAQEEGLVVPTDASIIADGGVSKCTFLMQEVSNLIGRKIVCPLNVDTTATGAAYLAGLGLGFWKEAREIQDFWKTGSQYEPQTVSKETKQSFTKWSEAIRATLQYSSRIAKI